MKPGKLFIMVILWMIPAFSFAGEVHGTITDTNGKPFPNVKVTILTAPDGKEIASHNTDATGYFKLQVGPTGAVWIKAGDAPAIKITSNFSPTGYRFKLIQNKGQWQLLIQP